MSTSLRAVWGVALVLLFALTACDGDNVFPMFGVGTGNGDGQNATLEGTVTSAGQGIGAVRIVLTGGVQDSTLTNSQGQYRFEQLAASTYTVGIRVPPNFTLAPGQPLVQTVQLAAGELRAVNWQLIAQPPLE